MPVHFHQSWTGAWMNYWRGSEPCARSLAVPSSNRPESYLNNLPGHLWRDKWTALSGPHSVSVHSGPPICRARARFRCKYDKFAQQIYLTECIYWLVLVNFLTKSSTYCLLLQIKILSLRFCGGLDFLKLITEYIVSDKNPTAPSPASMARSKLFFFFNLFCPF